MDLNEARTALMTVWTGAMENVLDTMAAKRPPVEWHAIEGALPDAADGEARAWWADSVNVIPRPSIWIGAPDSAWKALGQWILGALGVDDAGDEDIQSTCRDVVAQVASAFAGELAKQLGTALNSGGTNPAEGPADGAFLVDLALALPPDTVKIPFFAAFDPSLVGLLGGDSPEPAAEAAAAPAPATGPVMSEPIGELRFPVYVRLGVTTAQLGDVFKWTIGSVVEIGRRITDPVDVVVGDRVIAKGQVVVCQGHYGARLTSIERGEAEDF